jgi:hypothetical protein
VTVVYERLQARRRPVRQRISAVSRVSSPVVAALVLAAGLETARRRLTTPSLVDDWFGVAYGRHAFKAILHLNYGAEHADVAGRYRPAYTGLWNYLQWHLLGSPSVGTALAWGVLRIAAFVLAVWLLARWATAGWAPTTAWLAPLAVCLTPGFAVDLVRHGPADPLMISGLILGLAAVGVGVRDLLAAGSARAPAVLLVAVGYVVYVFGVYSKEASIAVLAFVPFFLKWAAPSLRALVGRSRKRGCLLGTVAAFLLAPLMHVAFHVALAAANGDNPYPIAHFGLARKALAAGLFPLIGAPAPLGTIVWLGITPVVVFYVLQTAWSRDRDAWLLGGLLTTGFLMSAFSLARGDTPSRYYLPWIVAVSAVGVRAVTRQNSRPLAYAALAVILAMTATSTRSALAAWTNTERSGSAALELAGGVVTARCPLYLVNFDVERRVAIPRLLSTADATPRPACGTAAAQTYALTWLRPRMPAGFSQRCRRGWTKLEQREHVSLYRCASFAGGSFLDQDAASGAPGIDVVRLRIPIIDRTPRTFTPPAQNR